MGEHRLISLVVIAALGASASACSSASGEPDGTRAAVTIQADDSDGSFTLTSASGECVASEQFYAENNAVLTSHCGAHALPLPQAWNDPSCAPGQIASLTFDCYEGDLPPLPGGENTCLVFVVKDGPPLPPNFGHELPGKPALFCTVLPAFDESAPPPPPVGGGDGTATVEETTKPPPWPVIACCPDPPPPPEESHEDLPPIGGSSK